MIYASWLIFSYKASDDFPLAFTFLSIFFVIFYITFLAYKLKANVKFWTSDIVLLLLNSFIFYGIGYGLLSDHETGKELLGVFTLGNAVIHFAVSTIIFKKKLADRSLFYLVSGLVLVFITIAIPVQLDGNWVTLLWCMEAALLFWIGRTKKVPVYEYLSYPLMALGMLSLVQDWWVGYVDYSYLQESTRLKTIFNQTFLTSVLFLVAFGFINWINSKHKNLADQRNTIQKIMSYGIPAILIVVLYCTFYLEIGYYCESVFLESKIILDNGDNTYPQNHYNYDLKDFGTIWMLNYTMLFLSVLSFANIKKIKNRAMGIVTISFGLLATFYFLTWGLYLLSELRESYIDQTLSEYYKTGFFNVGIRYVVFAFFALFMAAIYQLSRQPFMKINFKIPFEIITHICILWITSSELLNWMDIAGSSQTYKLGLSILWGTYALLLIAIGIWKHKKYLRIGAIVLFAITLLKLFFYDIASLNTISKTIVFVSLGVLLLIISFLYNKYKHIITDESEK